MPTKQEIIDRMLSQISNDYDKSEGSFIFDAVVGVATALEDGYFELETFEDKAFADTAYDFYLDKTTSELGVFRKPAIKATTTLTVYGANGTVIPVGSRFYVDDIYFSSTESKTISTGSITVPVECEQEGSVGNVPVNSIVNSEFISGVTAVTNEIAVTNGVDKENDEELRKRFYEKVRAPATSGNIYDYRNWCNSVSGVGATKVIPTWNGNGTVKCIIINSNKRAADTNLVNTVITNVEAQRPIGATVTVISSTELPINISVDVDLNVGYTLQQVTTNITNAIVNHLKEIAFVDTYVSYALIGSVILSVDGVKDYRNLTVNSGTVNITIGTEQVAVGGTINVT